MLARFSILPSLPSTYANLPCTSPYCTYLPSGDKCDPANYCKFSNNYLDGITVKGLLGMETLMFETSDEGEAKISNMVIRCGHDNDRYNDQPSGIMGLGPENVSLATKMGSKFSYCIGSFKDPHYAHNQLILGDDAVFNNLYFLTLEGISVGEKMLDIDPAVFRRRPSGMGGLVINFGTTIILLTSHAFDPLSNEAERLLNGSFERVEKLYSLSDLCYRGNMSHDLTGSPWSRFTSLNFFHDNGPGEFCMAVSPSSSDVKELSVIGVMAQQSCNIGYDIGGKKIFFQRIDRKLLE
ncbi:hypothetical protein ACJRO7_013292 [Eucalyptus globulus]|uniref:Peptidase A1 domain-containing protein n=1 Tax=Eucalyptus globulus TaxID=34317 RepID=A0ABD3L727_EUCGL